MEGKLKGGRLRTMLRAEKEEGEEHHVQILW